MCKKITISEWTRPNHVNKIKEVVEKAKVEKKPYHGFSEGEIVLRCHKYLRYKEEYRGWGNFPKIQVAKITEINEYTANISIFNQGKNAENKFTMECEIQPFYKFSQWKPIKNWGYNYPAQVIHAQWKAKLSFLKGNMISNWLYNKRYYKLYHKLDTKNLIDSVATILTIGSKFVEKSKNYFYWYFYGIPFRIKMDLLSK